MVRTRPRPAAPAALTRNKGAWTDRWKEIHAAGTRGDWATPAAKRVLKTPLLAMTWGKCAFCESPLEVQAFAQVEHYISKRVACDKAFEWKNLFPVCQICNTCKGDADHGGSLLKPDLEDPELFFWLSPEGDLEPYPGLSDERKFRAEETIRLCNLNRGSLREARQDVANELRQWFIDRAEPTWDRLSNPRKSYKLVIRHLLTIGRLPDLAALDRKRFQMGN
jgi:uncharacterized protein (TIGR02646 family)